jgi:hypothetical protein
MAERDPLPARPLLRNAAIVFSVAAFAFSAVLFRFSQGLFGWRPEVNIRAVAAAIVYGAGLVAMGVALREPLGWRRLGAFPVLALFVALTMGAWSEDHVAEGLLAGSRPFPFGLHLTMTLFLLVPLAMMAVAALEHSVEGALERVRRTAIFIGLFAALTVFVSEAMRGRLDFRTANARVEVSAVGTNPYVEVLGIMVDLVGNIGRAPEDVAREREQEAQARTSRIAVSVDRLERSDGAWFDALRRGPCAGKVGEPLLACVYGFAYEERAALLQRRALLRNLSSASAALALMAAVVAIRGRLRRSRGLAAAGHSGKV